MKHVLGWHNFDEHLRLIQAQLVQVIAQSQSLSKAISEVLQIEDDGKSQAEGRGKN